MKKGFTLIEIIVATAIFSIVMVIALGAVLTAVDANRKAQSLNNVINNLNFALESMVRDLRTGSGYITQYGCLGDSDRVTFTDKEGANVTYSYNNNDKSIEKELAGNSVFEGRITSSEVSINSLTFISSGCGKDNKQEMVYVKISGESGNGKTLSKFDIQTLVVPRVRDRNEFN